MSLADVMSEELADQLQKKEYRHIDQAEAAPSPDTGAGSVDTGPDIPPDIDYDTSDDAMIAMMLQKQFDKEADLQLAKEEQSLNRNSKVTVTYAKYRMIPEEWAKYDSSEEVRYLHLLNPIKSALLRRMKMNISRWTRRGETWTSLRPRRRRWGRCPSADLRRSETRS